MAAIRNDLDRWETPLLWMYLDSVGLVTVGCGTMLPDAASAAKIAFFHKANFAAASVEDITAAWNTLHAGAAGQKKAVPKDKFSARHYEAVTDLRITIATSDALRDAHILADYTQLRAQYSGFDELPDDARLALFDMIYNLGAGGLKRFGSLKDAITSGDWTSASLACVRHGIPAERNQMTSKLFQNCASTKGQAPSGTR